MNDKIEEEREEIGKKGSWLSVDWEATQTAKQRIFLQHPFCSSFRLDSLIEKIPLPHPSHYHSPWIAHHKQYFPALSKNQNKGVKVISLPLTKTPQPSEISLLKFLLTHHMAKA